MEYRPLNLREIQAGASENLRKTYFSLGLAIPNTIFVEKEGFQACLGEFEHPICNFAAGLNLDPWSSKQLVSLAQTKSSFNVYALPGDSPEHLGELLYRSSFRVSYRLAQMVAEPHFCDNPREIRKATDPDTRFQIAKFMTEQFFPRQTEGFRIRVAQATSDAVDLDIYELVEGKQRVAAAMLCESNQVIGLYNLCVDVPKRGFGLGKAVTQWAIHQAHLAGKLVTLQCDSRIQGWYEEQAFCKTGTVDVFTLSKTGHDDIMDSN